MHPLFFSGIMLLIGLLLLWLINWLLTRHEKRSTDRVAKAPRFDSVESSSAPMRDPVSTFRDRALDNLDKQYTIIRRTIFLVIGVIWVGISIIPFLGTVSAGVISLLGAGGVVILGIAARPFLENLISGYVMTFSKQFYPGDTVMIDGEYGTIHDITPTHTVIRLWDWRRYVVPNSSMLNKEIFSYTNRDGLLWACLKFQVAYDADLSEVRKIAIESAGQCEHLIGDDPPQLWVMRMDRESIECWLTMWVEGPSQAWAIRVETAELIINAFAQRGIRSHVYQVGSQAGNAPGFQGPPANDANLSH